MRLDGEIVSAESATAIFDKKYEDAERELETATELLKNTKEALIKAQEEGQVLKDDNAKEMAEHHDIRVGIHSTLFQYRSSIDVHRRPNNAGSTNRSRVSIWR